MIAPLRCNISLALATLLAPAAVAQEPLGKPAGWAVDDAPELIDVTGGSELRLEPDPAATVLEILPEARLPLIETRGSWVKVRYGDRFGWVDLEGGREPGAAPPVEVVRVEPEPEPLDLDDGFEPGELGPYELFSEVDEPALIDHLARVAADVGRAYGERYGLAVDAELSGSVVLFAGRQPFLDFQRARAHGEAEGRIDAYFHSPGTVVMYRGNNPRLKLAATLIHELTHLINWRTLRAGGRRATPMPPWLEEGMAEDMSLARLDRKQGRLAAEPLGPSNLRYGRRLGARLFKLEQAIALGGTAPSLQRLLEMDKEAFFGGNDELNYLMSAMWIRYLLSGVEPELAGGFRAFLAAVAAGGEPDAEELRSRLGRDWSRLAGDFRGWLRNQRARIGL